MTHKTKSSQILILVLIIFLNLNCQKSADLIGCWQGIDNEEYFELFISDESLRFIKSWKGDKSHLSFPTKEHFHFKQKINGRRKVDVGNDAILSLTLKNKLLLEIINVPKDPMVLSKNHEPKKIIELRRIECNMPNYYKTFSLPMHEYRKQLISRELDYIEQFGDLKGQNKNELREHWISIENHIFRRYYLPRIISQIEGTYDIDTTKENIHSHKKFQFVVSKKKNHFEMNFISCEKYGYSDIWNKGDTFGYIDTIQDKKEIIYTGRINEHRGADSLELTEHLIQVKDNEIIIFTGDHKDHYKKIKN